MPHDHRASGTATAFATIALSLACAGAGAQTPDLLDDAAVRLLAKDRYVAGIDRVPIRELASEDLELLRASMSTTLRRQVTTEEARAAQARLVAQARQSGKAWPLLASFRRVPKEGTGAVGNFVDARLTRWLEAEYPGLDSRLTLPRSQSSDGSVHLPGQRAPILLAQSKVSNDPARAFHGGIDDLVAFGGGGLAGGGTAFEVFVTQETIEWATDRGYVDERGFLREDRARPVVESRRDKVAARSGPNAERARRSDVDRLFSADSRVRFSSLGTYESLRSASDRSRREARELARELGASGALDRPVSVANRPPVSRAALRGLALFELGTAAQRLSDAAVGDRRMSALEWGSVGADVLAGGAASLDALAASGGRFAKSMPIGSGRAVPILLAAGEAIQLARLANGELTPGEYGRHATVTAVSLGGAYAGAWVGGIAGGAMGSLFGPAGAATGVWVGEFVGGWAGAEILALILEFVGNDATFGAYYYQ